MLDGFSLFYQTLQAPMCNQLPALTLNQLAVLGNSQDDIPSTHGTWYGTDRSVKHVHVHMKHMLFEVSCSIEDNSFHMLVR